MRRPKHLVCQHLENLSAKLLAEYQDSIREYIRGRHGIYALYKKDRLYYVGLATNLKRRLSQHLRDRHRGLWDRFSVYLVIDDSQIKELESLVLRIVQPKGNKQRGKLLGSQNLLRELARELRDRQREELLQLVGRKQRRRQAKRPVRTAAATGGAVLARYIKGPMKIRAVYKGKVVRAHVRRDGWIRYNGYLYKSPSGITKDICVRRRNGWQFWKYERAPGDWVSLAELKR